MPFSQGGSQFDKLIRKKKVLEETAERLICNPSEGAHLLSGRGLLQTAPRELRHHGAVPSAAAEVRPGQGQWEVWEVASGAECGFS